MSTVIRESRGTGSFRGPFSVLVLAIAAFAVGLGCTPQDSVPMEIPEVDARDDDLRDEPTNGTDDTAEETWMACFIKGSKIGYMHSIARFDEQTELWHFEYDDMLTLKRFGDVAVMRTRLSSVETAEGGLVKFTSEVNAGTAPTVTKGRVQDGKLVLQTTTAGKTTESSIDWDSRWGGFFADKLLMRRAAMKPGDRRQLTALLPVVNQPGKIDLQAEAFEATKLLDETKQLLKVNMTTQFGPASLKSVVWVDDQGNEWKMRDLQLGMEAFRTSREVAIDESQPVDFDFGASTIVRVDRRLDDPHATRRVVYRARLQDGEAATIFAEGPSQRVRQLADGVAEVEVRAIRPDDSAPGPDADSPTAADRQASNMIQCDDRRVVGMANHVAPGETDPWAVACALEKLVQQKIQLKNYSTAMASAAEVAKSLEGDCTEHAVLLAALCRARDLPARVVIGLVYYGAEQAFAYHMWTEAWIKDRWIPLDGTLGRGGIGAAHLKLSHSSMAGPSALAEMLPVLQALGRLELEIAEVQR